MYKNDKHPGRMTFWRNLFYFLLLFAFDRSACFAQKYSEQSEIFRRIVRLIKEDRVAELATMVRYPLGRPDPLPSISSENDFILYYPVLFDSVVRKEITNLNVEDVFEQYGNYSVGDIWICDGKIYGIYYTSEQEKSLQLKVENEIRNRIYPELKEWKEHILTWDANNLVVRVDWISKDSGYRYAIWPKGRSISEKPDLILYNGKSEPHGNMGSITYTFKNGHWSYILDYWVHEELPHLRILYDDVEQNKIECKWLRQLDCK
ncbi:hypothetical protein JNM05_01065 [bacterium]|nr:hypothetical protein [bacterium]